MRLSLALLMVVGLAASARAQVQLIGDSLFIGTGVAGSQPVRVQGLADRASGTGTILHLVKDSNGDFFTDSQVPRKNQAELITGLWDMNGLTIQSVTSLTTSGGALVVSTPVNVSGNITATSGSVHARGAVANAAIGSDNIRMGTAAGTPRIIFEDATGTKQWSIDNLAGAMRTYRTDNAGTADHVAISMGDIWQYAPPSREILPLAPYGFSLGNPFFPLFTIWAAELNVQQLVSREKIITTGGNFTVGRSTTILEGITSASTSVKTRHNDIRPGDVLFFGQDGKFEAAGAGALTPINRCRFNCAADDGTTGWAGDSTTVTFDRETRWQGEGAIFVPSNASQNVYNIHPDNYANSTQYTVSIFIRRADGAAVVPSGSAYRLLIDGTNVDATAIDMGNAWYRLWATRTVGVGGNRTLGVTSMAAGVAHYVDAAQIEAGSTLTEWSQYSSQYTLTRNLDGSSANAWDAGSAIFNTGSTSSAWINAYADSSIRGLSSYGSQVLSARPVAYWRFGTTAFVDAQFFGFHLTHVGGGIGASSSVGSPVSDGQGGAYQSGSGSYLTRASHALLQTNGSMTAEFFVYMGSLSATILMAKGAQSGGGGIGEFSISPQVNGSIVWMHGNGTTMTTQITPCPAGTLTAAVWHYIALVRDDVAKTVTCYRNGAVHGSATYVNSAAATATGLGIFAYNDGTFPLPNNSHLDEVALYDVALSPADIVNHYDARTRTLPETQYGPTIAGLRRNSATWSDYSTVWVIGNLIGHCDNVVMSYGAIFGPCSGAHLQMDNAQGIRGLYNTTLKFGISLAGVATFVEGAVTIDNLGLRIFNSSNVTGEALAYSFAGALAYTKRPLLGYLEDSGAGTTVVSGGDRSSGNAHVLIEAPVGNVTVISSDFDVTLSAGDDLILSVVDALTINSLTGFSGTKVAGACTITFTKGIVTNVTGC